MKEEWKKASGDRGRERATRATLHHTFSFHRLFPHLSPQRLSPSRVGKCSLCRTSVSKGL